MDGTTKSKVTFTTSGTDATYKATFTLGSYSGSATSTTKELTYAIPISWCNAVPNATTGKANVNHGFRTCKRGSDSVIDHPCR